MKGGRRQGGQSKRWEDNIREWTGLEFGKSQRAVENREKMEKKKKKTGCKIICAAPTTLAVKGLMMMMMMTTDILGSQQIHRQVCENSTLQNEAIGIILKTSKDTPTGTLRFMQYLLPMQTRQNVEQVCWQTELKQFMEFENTKTYSVTSMRRSCQVFWINIFFF